MDPVFDSADYFSGGLGDYDPGNNCALAVAAARSHGNYHDLLCGDVCPHGGNYRWSIAVDLSAALLSLLVVFHRNGDCWGYLPRQVCWAALVCFNFADGGVGRFSAVFDDGCGHAGLALVVAGD